MEFLTHYGDGYLTVLGGECRCCECTRATAACCNKFCAFGINKGVGGLSTHQLHRYTRPVSPLTDRILPFTCGTSMYLIDRNQNFEFDDLTKYQATSKSHLPVIF